MSARRPAPVWRLPAAVATALAGLATVVSSLSPNAAGRGEVLDRLEPTTAQAAAHAAGVIGGIALVGIAFGLLSNRRKAWHAAVSVLVVVAIVNAAKGLDYEEALIALVVAGLLRAGVRAGRHGAPPSRPAVAALVAVAAVGGAYVVTLTFLLVAGHSPGVGAGLASAARALVDGAALPGLATPLELVAHVALGCALLALVWALRCLLAPARARDGHDVEAHHRASAIVARHGTDTIAPFVLRADKAFFFAHGGVLAYRTLRETAVVSGDPVGPEGSAAPILRDFVAVAIERGWDVVVSSASDRHLGAYRELGLRTMQIGCEAVVDPSAFSLAGRRGRTVRKAVHRVAKHGWTIEVVPGGAALPGLAPEIAAVERAWRLAHPRLTGFAMASDRLWGAPEDAADVHVLARAPGGELRAFQRYVPFRGGLSLDAMRRLDDEPNGISDAMVAAALEHAREAGCRAVSLNFAGFAHIMAADSIGARSRPVARAGLRLIRGRFQLDRLVRASQKFSPEWRPRFLVFTARTRLPLAALRVLQSEAYVRSPRPLLHPDAWRPLARPVARSADPRAAG